MKFIKTTVAKELEETVVDLDFTPKRGTDGSAGFDLKAAIEAPVTIFPDQVETIPTGVKVWIGSSFSNIYNMPDGTGVSVAGLLFPRSSTKGCILNNTIGVIDEDYQNEIFVKLRNITDKAITIETGERFAQLVFTPVYIPVLTLVDEFDSTTVRGEGGFGHTDQQDLLGR